MNEFPLAPLTCYTDASDTSCSKNGRFKGDGMRMFARDLKAWLKNANLDLEFIGLNLGKSLSTVRNWMTGNVWVQLSQLKTILAICQAHEAGGRGLTYKKSPQEEDIDFIWVRPYIRVVSSVFSENEEAPDERPVYDPDGRIAMRYEKWCAAANVPENTLFEQKGLYYPMLARFVTDTIMKATRTTLHTAQERGLLNAEFITHDPGLRDMGAVLQGTPCDCCFFEGMTYVDGLLEPAPHIYREDIRFFLPVIKNEWRSDFVRWAASFSDKETTDLWIVDQLNKKARQKISADVTKFIKTSPLDLED